MKLTRKKAIELCIELWTWLAKTGKEKEDWPEWVKYQTYNIPSDDGTLYECWFCEYGYQRAGTSSESKCNRCPYFIKFGHCYRNVYNEWHDAKTLRTRKKYAKLFLEQIRKLK